MKELCFLYDWAHDSWYKIKSALNFQCRFSVYHWLISPILSYLNYWYSFLVLFLTGYCVEGYYCNHTSTEPDQYVCPAGHYCPTGTGVPNACPEGTFSSTEGNNDAGDCLNCTAGYYCQGILYTTHTTCLCSVQYCYSHWRISFSMQIFDCWQLRYDIVK